MTAFPRINLLQLAGDVGVPARVICPLCGGGSDQENCFSLWENYETGQLMGTCHRATCDVGTISTPARGASVARTYINNRNKQKKAPRKFRAGIEGAMLSAELWRDFNDLYPFEFSSEGRVRNRVRRIGSDYAFPMMDAEGSVQGRIIKRTSGKGPKSLTYKNDDYDGMSWYIGYTSDGNPDLYIVEDVVSALALYDMGYDAVSLNGTKISPDRLDHLLSYKWRLFLCLDADATRQAIKICQRYRTRADITVKRLEKDIKNMTREEVEEWLP